VSSAAIVASDDGKMGLRSSGTVAPHFDGRGGTGICVVADRDHTGEDRRRSAAWRCGVVLAVYPRQIWTRSKDSLMSRSPSLPLVAGLALVTLTACGPKIRFSDSVDNVFDLRVSHRYKDRLSSPYVAGARFAIYVYDTTSNNSLTGWRLESRDPEVIDIVDQWVDRDDLDPDGSRKKSDVLVARVEAVGAGTVILEVFDDNDDFVRATEVEVMQPDRVQLRAAGPLFIRREDVVPSLVDDTPKVVAGGTATFLVEWYAGERKLSGAGALGLSSDHEIVTELRERKTVLSEDRDWITVTMGSSIAADEIVVAPIEIMANGEPIVTREFDVVGADTLSYVELHGQREAGVDDDTLLVVLAQVFDEDGESVWGVAFDWDLAGVDEDGVGDLFRYWFKRGAWNTLGAEFNGLRAEVEIQGEEGYVTSSNRNIGCLCTADGQAPGSGVGFGLLALSALGLVRRRRS
jgi:MYXO-CTERM domain-containing protein